MQTYIFPRLVCVIMASLIFISPTLAQSIPAIEDVIDRVIHQETQLQNLEVKHFIGQELVLKEDGHYTATPYMLEGRVIYDGIPDGKFIAEIAKETFRFRRDSLDRGRKSRDLLDQGQESWITTSSSKSYDGSSGRWVEHGRPDATTVPVRRSRQMAQIAGASPYGQSKNLLSMSDGSAATLGYFRGYVQFEDKKYYRLGESLKKLIERKTKLDVSLDKIDGLELIKVADPWSNAYWFDPSHGYALRRVVAATPPGGSAAPLSTLVVENLIQLNDTVWYPSKGYWEDPWIKEGKSRRWEFSASGVSMSNTPPTSFTASIPEGYFVNDMVSNKRYISAGILPELNEHLEGIRRNVEKEVGNLPPSTAPMPATAQENTSNKGILGAVLGVLVVVIAVGAAAYWRRNRKISSP